MLSTALVELWQGREGRTIRRARYEETGGVRGAVGRLAEAAYARLDEAQQGIARAIFLRKPYDEHALNMAIVSAMKLDRK